MRRTAKMLHILSVVWSVLDWFFSNLAQMITSSRTWCVTCNNLQHHHHTFVLIIPLYGDVMMGAIASQITSLTIVNSTVYSDADQRKHQSSASLAFVRRIRRGLVNSLHKWPVTRKIFPFDDVIMTLICTFSATLPCITDIFNQEFRIKNDRFINLKNAEMIKYVFISLALGRCSSLFKYICDFWALPNEWCLEYFLWNANKS